MSVSIHIWILDNQSGDIHLENPLNYSYDKIKRVYESTITNYAKLYRALVQIYLNWSKREAYLGFVMKPENKNISKKLSRKLKEKEHYIFN